ncbi:hypothetical protein PTKIN_Ptkin12aG0101900 [Pterospermum kingtungense]
MALRVLLVEADDSTRQIIAALLRRCSFRDMAKNGIARKGNVIVDVKIGTILDLPQAAAATANANALAARWKMPIIPHQSNLLLLLLLPHHFLFLKIKKIETLTRR